MDSWDFFTYGEEQLSFDMSNMESPEKRGRRGASPLKNVTPETPIFAAEDCAIEAVEAAGKVKYVMKVTFEGFTYSRKSVSAKGEHAFYHCPSYRPPQKCGGRLIMFADGRISVKAPHTCSQTGTMKPAVKTEIYDASLEMREMVKATCLDDSSKSSTDVAKEVFNRITAKYEGKNYTP